jgi:hypothetical protein
MRHLAWLYLSVLVLAAVEPSLAQGREIPSPAPAPLLGLIGLPLAGLVLGAVWLVRRRANRN